MNCRSDVAIARTLPEVLLHRSLPSWLATLIVLTLTPRAVAADAEDPPQGIWELAATFRAPFDMRLLEPLAGVLVTSDMQGAVAALRPDSGLVVWNRKVPASDAMSGVWLLPSAEGGIVLAAGDGVQAFRADVGTRVWERDLGCLPGGCQTRVIHAAAHDGGKDALLFLATGGIVQSEVVRLDPFTGKPMWRRAAEARHPKRVLATPQLLVVEDSQAPFAVRFIDPADGRALGVWEPIADGAPKPLSELLWLRDGRLAAIDLRPAGTVLAQVTILNARGEAITERQIPRAQQVTNAAVLAAELDDGLAIFTPDPSAGASWVTAMLLAPPFTAKTEQVRSWAEPVMLAGRWAFAPSAAGGVWSTTGAARWSREVIGIDPTHARTLAVGGATPLLALIDLGADAQRVATLDQAGRLHGIGAPELGQGSIDRALAVGGELLLTRGKSIFRLALVPWGDAVAKLKAARQAGSDVGPYLERLAAFGPPAKSLAEAVGTVKRDPRAPDAKVDPKTNPGPEAPIEWVDMPRSITPLSPADAALVQALREAWIAGPGDALQGMNDLVAQAPEKSARRLALLEAFAPLLLEMVLAPGGLPPGEEAATHLVALARALEWESQSRQPNVHTLAVYATVMALADEALAGADVLSRSTDGRVAEARLELARRALHLLHKSAGTLKTETSRQMLVSGLRFFRHLEALFGAELASVNALLDRVANKDVSAVRPLEAALLAVEGPMAARRGPGPALCRRACETALAMCGAEVGGSAAQCQARCDKSGAVRFGNTARPVSSDPLWFCR